MKKIKILPVMAMLCFVVLTPGLSNAQRSPGDTSLLKNFVFKDSLNRDVRIADFAGKLVLVDIWYSGCGACIDCNQGLKTVHDHFKDAAIVFLSISIDRSRERWMLSVKKATGPSNIPWAGKYEPAPGTVVLYTGGSGPDNDFIKRYVPKHTYPQLLVVGKAGQLLSNTPPRPDYHPENLIDYLTPLL